MHYDYDVRQLELEDERRKCGASCPSKAVGADSPEEGLEADSQEQVPCDRPKEHGLPPQRGCARGRGDLPSEYTPWESEEEAQERVRGDDSIRHAYRQVCRAIHYASISRIALKEAQKALQEVIE